MKSPTSQFNFFFILATPRAQGNTKMKTRQSNTRAFRCPHSFPECSYKHASQGHLRQATVTIRARQWVFGILRWSHLDSFPRYRRTTSRLQAMDLSSMIPACTEFFFFFFMLSYQSFAHTFSYNTYRTQNTCVINFSVFLASHAVYIFRPHHISIGFDSISDFIQP